MSPRTATALLALAFTPLVLAFQPRADSIQLSAKDGTKLSKELAISGTFTMEGGTASVMGEEQEIPAEDEPLELDMTLEVTDEYSKVADGRAVELLRTFDGMAMEYGAGEDGGEVDEFTELEGSTVKFVRGEEGRYEKSFHEEEGEETLLTGLEADMDFVALLPEKEVSPDDTWKASGANLKTVFLPGGVPLGAGSDDENVGTVVRDLLIPMIEDGAGDFAIECTYKGVREDDEQRIAEIALEFEGMVSGEASELVLSIAEVMGEGEGAPEDLSADAEIEFSGEGTLLWNVEGGHVHSYECAVSTDIILMLDFSQDMGGGDMEINFEAEFSGDVEWALSVAE